MKKKLTLSKNRKVAGVLGGIGEYFDVDPTVIRLAFIVLAVCTALVPAIIGYFIASAIIPNA
jgi:phage shock protein C